MRATSRFLAALWLGAAPFLAIGAAIAVVVSCLLLGEGVSSGVNPPFFEAYHWGENPWGSALAAPRAVVVTPLRRPDDLGAASPRPGPPKA
jgi:hypothetical protein